MPQLTEEQQRALSLEHNISVTAGAGAGKTLLLVERFLKIAVENYRGQAHKVRRILAITFTNKAAGEMKERIAEAINRRIAQSKDPSLRNHLLHIRDQLNSVAISTIHAFCTRVLREYPIEAGLAPDFSELDDMQAAMLSDEAIEETLHTINTLQDKEEFESFKSLFEFWERRTVTRMLRTALQHPYEMETILQTFEAFDAHRFFDFISDLWQKEMRSLLHDDRLRFWRRLIREALQEIADPPPAEIEETVNALRSCASLPEQVELLSLHDFRNLLTLSQLFTGGQGQPYTTLSKLGKKKNWPRSAHEALLALSRTFSDWLLQAKGFFPGPPPDDEDERQAFAHVRTFFRLYRKAALLYETKKREVPAVDFEDLLLKTYRLLQNNESVRQELSARYEFIMVDEFQDTNALQWQIIALLASDDKGLASHKIFIVGDPKQSIYGFRNADIRIFRQVKETFAGNAGFDDPAHFPGNVVLQNSFRFSPDLNAFINDLFDHILRPDERNDFEVEFQPLVAQRSAGGESHIELALLEAEEEVTEEAYIAATIHRLIDESRNQEQAIRYGDIAVLLRSRNNLLAIEQALRNYGIPFKTVKGIGYWQQQEIYDFYHLLRFLADPADDFSLIGILRSKLFLVADDILYFLAQEAGETVWQKLNSELNSGPYPRFEKARLKSIRQMLNRWLQLRDFLPLNELLEAVLDDLQYRALLTSQINGEQLLANIEKFIEHVFRFNSSGILGLVDLIRQVELFIEQSLREGEPQINLEDKGTVKLMTIHAAKGLQFPVVFIPYLNTDNLKKSGSAPHVFLDAQLGIAAAPRDDLPLAAARQSDNGKKRYTLFHLLKLQQKKKDLAEAKRIFYVGVTRASDHLFLSAQIKRDRQGRPGVQPHSALQWIVEHFKKQNFLLFDSEQTEYRHEEYTLHIVRSLPEQARAETKIADWLNNLRRLQQHILQPQSADEERLALYLPLQDQPGPITFSATRLMTFVKDPREYYRRYHLGFFESDYELFADAIYKEDDALIKGKIMHRFLQLLSEGGSDDAQILERVLFEFEVFDPQKQAQFREEILFLKEKITRSKVGKRIIQAQPARNEIPVTMRLGNDYFTGTVDRIIRDENHLWHVIDYKTNRITKSRLNSAGKKYEVQMKGYALLLSRLLPQQESYPVDLYFIHPDALYSQTYSMDDIRNIEKEFLQLIAQIKERFPVGNSGGSKHQ